MFSLKSFNKIFRLLKPHVLVGGLELSDAGVTYIALDPESSKINQFSVKLIQGTISNGKLLNKEDLITALKNLHKQITSNSLQKLPVSVSLCDSNVYTQQFSLPQLKSSSFEEAVRLNLQVISPIEFSKTYSDWQKIEKEDPQSNEVDVLASFTDKDIVNPIFEALNEGQFIPVSVEQKAASLARLISKYATGYEKKHSYFILHISSDGLSFSIVRYGFLYFNRFTPWSSIIKQSADSRQIPLKEFSDNIVQESQRVINFYSGHFSDTISSIYIIAPGLEEQVRSIIQSHFSLTIEPTTLKNYTIDHSWLVTFGVALRGLVPRSIDTEISLAPEGTEDQFHHSQILSFISLWRKIVVSSFAIILVACLGVYLFLNSYMEKITQDFHSVVGNYNLSRLNTLKQEAEIFNKSIDRAVAARQQQTRWEKVLRSIFTQAGSDVSIDRVYVQSMELPVVMNAQTFSSDNAVAFRNRLAKLPYLSNVDLPLNSITSGEGGAVTFLISFRVTNLNI